MTLNLFPILSWSWRGVISWTTLTFVIDWKDNPNNVNSNCYTHTHTHARTHAHKRLTALRPGLPRWAGTRKLKPIWILLKQETVSGSGISWAICKSAPRSRQITTPAPHHSVFIGRMPFLPPNQQRQSTEGKTAVTATSKLLWDVNVAVVTVQPGGWATVRLCCVSSLLLWRCRRPTRASLKVMQTCRGCGANQSMPSITWYVNTHRTLSAGLYIRTLYVSVCRFLCLLQ